MKTLIVIICLALAALLMWMAQAHAHDWYTSTRDPESRASCCGGHDCAAVPLDADWIQPVADGFHVVMTLEQSRQINPYSQAPVDTVVPWSRVQVPPPGAETVPALYHLCIAPSQRLIRGGVYCLFAVPGL